MTTPRDGWDEEVWALGGSTDVGSVTFQIYLLQLHLSYDSIPLFASVYFSCLPLGSSASLQLPQLWKVAGRKPREPSRIPGAVA